MIHCHTWQTPFSKRQTPPSSDDEDDGLVARSAKLFAHNREVFIIHAVQDCEGVERVQLDNYDDYLLDQLNKDVDVTMDSEFPDVIKIEDVDDIQKERRKLISAKRAKRRHRTVETNQQGAATSTTPPRATSALSSTPAGISATSSLPGSRARRSGSLQPHPLSNTSRLPGDNSEAQARSWGTINP
jgi:hypothetical protein